MTLRIVPWSARRQPPASWLRISGKVAPALPLQLTNIFARKTPMTSDPLHPYGRPDAPWRRKLYRIIFESDTPAGRMFDLLLIGAILISVLAVILDSVPPIASRYGHILNALEWFFTI